MYAIKNRKYKKWLFGTDYNYSPPRQRLSENNVMIFQDYSTARREFNKRGCGKEYRIIAVELVEKKEF